MDNRPRTTLVHAVADISRRLSGSWQVQLELAARRPDLAAPLLASTTRSYQHFEHFCRRLASCVRVDRHGWVRPAHVSRKMLASAAVGTAFSLMLGVPGMQAADIHINAAVGDTGCDLIDAILSANLDAEVGGCTAGDGPDVIHLNGIDQLLSAADNSDGYGPTATPIIASQITIEGGSAVISRTVGVTDTFRILRVNSAGDLTLRDVTVGGGRLDGYGDNFDGGGIYNRGKLTVESSLITGNQTTTLNPGYFANNGGGLHNRGTAFVRDSAITFNIADGGGGLSNQGELTVENSTITDNQSGVAERFGSGGGILNFAAIAVRDSVISGNTASWGGGISNYDTVTVQTTVISGNMADSGGGIRNWYGTVMLHNSTIDGNRSAVDGGGIENDGTMTVLQSTISNNSALGEPYSGNGGGIRNSRNLTLHGSTVSGNSAVMRGGGIYNSGRLTVLHSTILNNRAEEEAGGIAHSNPYSLTTVGSTIVAGNQSGNSDVPDVVGEFTSLGYNLIGADATGDFTEPTDQTGTVDSLKDAALAQLADNGGPTWTHAPLPNSTALDGGTCAIPFQLPIAADQRGMPRPIDLPGPNVDDGCDIGAYESQLAGLSITKSALPNPVLAGQVLTYTLAFTNTGPSAAMNVIITDTLPVSVTYGGLVTASVGISQPDASVAVWQAPTLAPGAFSVVFTATVDLALSGSITNTVEMTTTTFLLSTTGLAATHSMPVVTPQVDVFLPAIRMKERK